ncbi:MAG: AAA family ATPase [Polyangiaceae bacterium]|nr:AAA family ATPase [Polyangiaceae bacterium]
MTQTTAPEADSAQQLEGGSYDVIRKRLLDQAAELGKKAEELNQLRIKTFGGSQLQLLATERVRTENNCVPRDIRAVQGKLLFGYNVFVGLKAETAVSDVFSVHNFVQNGESFDLSALPVGEGHYLADPTFLRDFGDLYRYQRDTKLLMLRTTDTRILAIFQVGARLADQKVFRWGIDKGGGVKFIDGRGDEDNVLPRQHDFEFTPVRREDQQAGDHPHFSILDEVFVETINGDLTIKVENNTKDGKGIYREAVEDANQTLDDADIQYAKVGVLVILKIKPYREEAYRYLVYNTRTQHVVRIDAIGSACHQLPEDQGIIFPGGYYLRTGDYKVFESDAKDLVFRRQFKAPNGEDVLFVYDSIEDGAYLLLPYNLIRKEVANPLPCHGYSIFDDGKLVIFKSLSDEPTKVHPMQIWQTPFCTQEHAAAAPTDGSFLAKVGNAELVRGISEALTLQRIASAENPTRQSYEDVVASCRRMVDSFYWLPNAEANNLAAVVNTLASTADLIIDEFEKVAAIRKRSADALSEAETTQQRIIDALRPNDMKSVEDFMGSLTELRKQRGHLITLREMRYMNLPRVDELEKQVVGAYDDVSKGAVEFLLQPTALQPLVQRLSDVVGKVGEAQKATELKPIAEDVDKVGEGLQVLSDIINGLKIEDPTQRTRILEGISEAYSQLNRARATLAGRRKELAAAEGKSEFAAQFKLFGQNVVSSLALCDTPEKCDETLSRLLLALEELEGRFGEFDAFLSDLTQKREEVTDSIAAKRQTLLDERQRRAQNIVSAADRIIAGIQRKARTFTTPDDLNTYFASDAMVIKLRDLAKQLFDIGASVKGDELESKLKSARQDAIRALRDKTDLFEGGDNVIRFGTHRFNVNTQPVELALVPRKDDGTGLDVLYLHLTGTDFFERIKDDALEAARHLWDQQLISETPEAYRAEYLAASILFAAERGLEGLSIQKLTEASIVGAATPSPDGANPSLLEIVRAYSQTRHDEGYERGVHDVDATLILDKAFALRGAAGLLRYAATPRGLATLAWASLPEEERAVLHRRARSYGRLRDRLGSVQPQLDLASEIEPRLAETASAHRIEVTEAERRIGARYLVDELAAERPRFVTSASATLLKDSLYSELDRAGSRREFDEDLRSLEKHPAERIALVASWLTALIGKSPDLEGHRHALKEASVLVATDRNVDREPSSAAVEVTVAGLLGQHPNVKERSLHVRLDEWLGRLERAIEDRAPQFRKFRKTKQEILDRERRRLRLDEFAPRILSSFVRNRLIDEVYLPLVGANLAKQMGSAGEGKRTDQMGLLLLISPPGYGKTTLMEYVANRLGLIFMKVNGPALGHEVKSIDPNDAPNATARQEVDKINLALEMGNNVMLYLDDIQHTNPELLQKFISLCDAQRRIEGVWNGRTRTYDMRGKKFCVVMAGNPYTETGEKFRIPDMLANRADTYNLGDILEGKDDLFALSYLENALTSNKALQPLSGRDPKDTHKLIRMAKGESLPMTDLQYPYSAAEVNEITEVLKRLFKVQDVLLKVNLEYIASASQDDHFRTEPPFKLQGSYRNMNKISEKIVSAHTEAEVDAIIDDHYAGESQTLTTGAEQNILKLGELRRRMSAEQAERWKEIKKGYVRVKMMGGKDDDPVARVTGALGGIGEQLDSVQKSLAAMASHAQEPARLIASELDKLHGALEVLAGRDLTVQVERDPAIAELLAKQLVSVESSLAPVVQAVANSLLLAGQSAQSLGREQSEALRTAISDAAKKVEQIAATQSQMAQAQAQQAQVLEQARQAAIAQQQQVAHAHAVAQQMAEVQQRLVREQQQAAQSAQQITQQAREVLAAQQQMAVHQAQMANHQQQITAQQHQMLSAQQVTGRRPTSPPPDAASLVQRPDASPEENEMVARAQQVLAAARQGAPPEVGAAVMRVEQRLGELTQLVQSLQVGIAQGVAQANAASGARAFRHAAHGHAQAQGQAVPRPAPSSEDGGSLRFDTFIDLQSHSNFYRWSSKGDVVNEGGVFVSTKRSPPNIGDGVVLRIQLPGGAELEARAVVEWTRPSGHQGGAPGFGARFVDLPTYARQLVDHFVTKRAPLVFEQA